MSKFKNYLKLKLKNDGLDFPAGIEHDEISERTTSGLGPVLFFKNPKDEEKVVYKVFRNVRRKKDEEILKNLKVRYDITLIFPGKISRELPKTFGHYHASNEAGVGYPEIYEVISGRAWFLMQRPAKSNPGALEEIYLAEAGAGEKVIIPPDFGHSSLNPGNENLVLANFIKEKFSQDYETYENMRGAGYYLLESKDGASVEFEKNSYYESVPEITKLKPREVLGLGINWSDDMYKMTENPESLSFLKNPEKYLELLTIDKCFRKI